MSQLIDLCTSEGQDLLQQVKTTNRFIQPNVINIFEKQKGRKNCGIQSCSLLLNAAVIGKAKPEDIELPYKEEKMFEFRETLKVKSQDQVLSEGGLTLQEVQKLLASHGHTAELHYASDCSVEVFRSKLKEALSSNTSETGIIINYFMEALGQGCPFGHHSPLAAYLEDQDMALLMDTWINTQECWAKVESIFNAMNTMDQTSGKTRGFVLFRKN